MADSQHSCDRLVHLCSLWSRRFTPLFIIYRLLYLGWFCPLAFDCNTMFLSFSTVCRKVLKDLATGGRDSERMKIKLEVVVQVIVCGLILGPYCHCFFLKKFGLQANRSYHFYLFLYRM